MALLSMLTNEIPIEDIILLKIIIHSDMTSITHAHTQLRKITRITPLNIPCGTLILTHFPLPHNQRVVGMSQLRKIYMIIPLLVLTLTHIRSLTAPVLSLSMIMTLRYTPLTELLILPQPHKKSFEPMPVILLKRNNGYFQLILTPPLHRQIAMIPLTSMLSLCLCLLSLLPYHMVTLLTPLAITLIPLLVLLEISLY